MEQSRSDIIKTNVNNLQQFNLNEELLTGYIDFFEKSLLSDIEIIHVCNLIVRSISQHYVKQLLKNL